MAATKIQRIDVSECIHAGWRNVAVAHYPFVVFVTIWCCAIGFAVMATAEYLEKQMRFVGIFFSGIADPLFFAFPFALVRTLRGEKFDFSFPAAGIPAILRILAFGGVIRLFAAVCALSLLAPLMGAAAAGLLGFLLALFVPFAAAIVATFFTVRLCFTPFVIMDSSTSCSLWEALSRSWRMTRGPVGTRVFILGLYTGIISLSCVVCFVVPIVLVGLPLMCSVLAAAYEFARPLRSEDARGEVRGPAALRAGRCESCGYSRSGITQDRCPECGEPYNDPTDDRIESEVQAKQQAEPNSPA